MKKQLALICAVAMLAGMLGGCHAIVSSLFSNRQGQVQEIVPTYAATAPTLEPTYPVEEATEAPEMPMPIEPEEPTQDPSYTITLHAAVQIFDAPSYDASYVRSVGEDGIYTIEEETVDPEGIRWGKLRSGLGWIDLDLVERELADPPAVTAARAEEFLPEEGKYHLCQYDDSAYTETVIFRPREILTDVTLSALTYTEDGYEVQELLFTALEMTPDMPLVAKIAFPGDMSTFGFSCKDSDGVSHYYILFTNGRNNALAFREMTD